MTGQEIADIVNKIISGLKRKRSTHYKHEAINWGDIRVIEVKITQEIYPEMGTPQYEVIISEAAPESVHFCIGVADIAYKKYGINIDVRTEW